MLQTPFCHQWNILSYYFIWKNITLACVYLERIFFPFLDTSCLHFPPCRASYDVYHCLQLYVLQNSVRCQLYIFFLFLPYYTAKYWLIYGCNWRLIWHGLHDSINRLTNWAASCLASLNTLFTTRWQHLLTNCIKVLAAGGQINVFSISKNMIMWKIFMEWWEGCINNQ